MVYIYRLKTSLPHSLSLSISSSRPVSLSVQPSVFFSGDPGDGSNGGWEASRPFRLISRPWYFSRFSSFRRSSIIRPCRKGNKKRDASVHMRLFVRLYPRDCDIYVRYCVAEYLDIQSIPKEVREAVAKIALYAAIWQTASFRCVVLSSLLRAFIRATGLYDETVASG